jgi:hypothetical protein
MKNSLGKIVPSERDNETPQTLPCVNCGASSIKGRILNEVIVWPVPFCLDGWEMFTIQIKRTMYRKRPERAPSVVFLEASIAAVDLVRSSNAPLRCEGIATHLAIQERSSRTCGWPGSEEQ